MLTIAAPPIVILTGRVLLRRGRNGIVFTLSTPNKNAAFLQKVLSLRQHCDSTSLTPTYPNAILELGEQDQVSPVDTAAPPGAPSQL